MARHLLKLVFLLPLVCVAADPPPPDSKPLEAGKNVPGSIHAFNVTGPRAKRYHCVITEHGFEPGIIVFARNFDSPDGLAAVKKLLSVIDDRIDKNYTRIRLNSFAVFFTDELIDVVGVAGDAAANAKNDDLREGFEKKLNDLANIEPKLRYVVVTLDHKDDLKKFGLDESKFVTVVMYNKLKIVAVYALAKNELTDQKIGEINDAITEKLGATRK